MTYFQQEFAMTLPPGFSAPVSARNASYVVLDEVGWCKSKPVFKAPGCST
jgi:hypothetical protein